MDEQRIPTRSEAEEQYTWDLRDIFPTDEAWFEEYERTAEIAPALEKFRGRLGESADILLSYLKYSDEVSVRMEKLYGYASCASDVDTGNARYTDMRGKAMGRWVEVSGADSFATPEILAISEDVLNGFYSSCGELETYRRPLTKIRLRAGHILSPAEEKILAAAGEVAEGPENIGSAFRNADLKFPDAEDSTGKKHPLSAGTYVPLQRSPDRVLRRNSFDALYSRYGEYKNTVAAVLDAQFRQLVFFSRMRKYPDTLTASLSRNEVPVEVYMNLISTVHDNMDKMYRYVALRKKVMGLPELHMYDVQTPIVKDAAVKISYDEAKKTVLEALAVLGDDYVELLKKGFSERWIDVYENQGKRSGAYSSGSSRPHPYVLLNHKDTLDCMFTIAHEMGHALHSYYSCENQPVCTSDYVIFVAEVASTCNEILLMEHLLSKTDEPVERAYLINHFLDEFKATVYRQTMFAEFELEMGHMAERGETLTADALCEKYLALNKLYFGPDMISDDAIALEWARIPHFFYNYYVFQYATGFSAAVAIAKRILSEGESAVKDYRKFLSGGCSTDPISLLRLAGVDMASPAPISSALELFGSLIVELEKITDIL